LNKGGQRHAEGPAKRAQFNDIYPALASFAFANEGLGLPNPLCEVDLGKATAFARRAQLTKKYPVFL